MNQDPFRLLQEHGYLNSPANRFFWKNATPSLRNHLRQFLLLAFSCAVPIALITSVTTLLPGPDRILVFLFYLMMFAAGLAALDLMMGLVMLFRIGEPIWSKVPLDYAPMVLAVLFLVVTGSWLHPVIQLLSPAMRILVWLALAASAWLVGSGCLMLWASRLYWHGIDPPRRKPHLILTSVLLASVLTLQFLLSDKSPSFSLDPQPIKPVLLLAFDAPGESFENHTQFFPEEWQSQTLEIEERDITNLWTELGAGAPASVHQASLVSYDAPLFSNALNRHDPTQALPARLFKVMGLSKPVTEGGRYRKYLWEILDDAGLNTFSFAFWHTYPASSRLGGVLTERWGPESDYPFINGLTPFENPTGLPPEPDSPRQATIHRENQTWRQLQEMAVNGRFQLAVAYFPLADQYAEAPDKTDKKADLHRFRSDQITGLLRNLPADTAVIACISNGRPQEGQPIQLKIVSNWLYEVSSSLDSHLELTPTLLNAWRLPVGLHMAPSRYQLPLAISPKTVDYGEPKPAYPSDARQNRDYHEELRSLGYVK